MQLSAEVELNTVQYWKKCVSLLSSTIYSIKNMNQKQKLITRLFYRNVEENSMILVHAGKIQSSQTGAQQV